MNKTLLKNINHNINMINKEIIKNLKANINNVSFDTTKKENYIIKLKPLLKKLIALYEDALIGYNFQKNQVISDFNIGIINSHFQKNQLLKDIKKEVRYLKLEISFINRITFQYCLKTINFYDAKYISY